MMTAKYFLDKERLEELEYFLQSLSEESKNRVLSDKYFLERFLRMLLKNGRFRTATQILQDADNASDPIFLHLWDEAHYGWHQMLTSKPLTPIQKFRIRSRNPPPVSICQDGVRPPRKMGCEEGKILRVWFNEHVDKPYPSPEEKEELAEQAGLSLRQVTMWFGNARRRLKRLENTSSRSGGRKQMQRKIAVTDTTIIQDYYTETQNTNLCTETTPNESFQCTKLKEITNIKPSPGVSIYNIQKERDLFPVQRSTIEIYKNVSKNEIVNSNTDHRETFPENYSSNNIGVTEIQNSQSAYDSCATTESTQVKKKTFDSQQPVDCPELFQRKENVLTTRKPLFSYQTGNLYSYNGDILKKSNHNSIACSWTDQEARGIGEEVAIVGMTQASNLYKEDSLAEKTVCAPGNWRKSLLLGLARGEDSASIRRSARIKNCNKVTKFKTREQHQTNKELNARTKWRLRVKMQSKSLQEQNLKEASAAYRPMTDEEIDSKECFRALKALCDRVEKETISPTDVAICLKLGGGNETNDHLEQCGKIAESGLAYNIAEKEKNDNEEIEDINHAEVDARVCPYIDDQFMATARSSFQIVKNHVPRQELGIDGHGNLYSFLPTSTKQHGYIDRQVAQRDINHCNSENVEWEHRLNNLPSIGAYTCVEQSQGCLTPDTEKQGRSVGPMIQTTDGNAGIYGTFTIGNSGKIVTANELMYSVDGSRIQTVTSGKGMYHTYTISNDSIAFTPSGNENIACPVAMDNPGSSVVNSNDKLHSTSPYYSMEQLCYPGLDSNITRVLSFNTGLEQTETFREATYSTVVGEAVQGLLNLSSSQDLDNSQH